MPTSEARKILILILILILIFLRNPHILLSTSSLWLPCVFLFSLKFRWLQRLLLNETMDVSSWNVDHVLKTAWSEIEQFEAGQMSALFHIFTCAFCRSCVVSFIVLPTLPSLSSAVLLKVSNTVSTGRCLFGHLVQFCGYLKVFWSSWSRTRFSSFN